MRERYIAPAIMLVAGAITSVFNIVNEIEKFESLKRLLLVLILFYIIGSVAAKIIAKAKNHEKEPKESENDIQMKEGQLSEHLADSKEQQN